VLKEFCCLCRIVCVNIYVDSYEGMVTMGATDVIMLYAIYDMHTYNICTYYMINILGTHGPVFRGAPVSILIY
jgi:hypothetical protein